jgi:hypothetical protein
MSELGQFAVGLAMGMAALGFFFGPIGKALAGRISGSRGKDPATGLTTGEMVAERMAALEERIVELEGERAQLEERLEFAERMLTKGAAS